MLKSASDAKVKSVDLLLGMITAAVHDVGRPQRRKLRSDEEQSNEHSEQSTNSPHSILSLNARPRLASLTAATHQVEHESRGGVLQSGR